MELRQMVRDIARELLQQMELEKARKPKILFVFCDSTAHEPFQDQFIELRNAGIGYDMLFLDGETSAWINMHRVESTGSTRVIAADEYAPAPIELPKEYEGVVVPEIDLDNASRVVTGMKGTVKAEIIFAALVLGKFVIVGEDVPGIKRSDRRTLQVTGLPAPYRKVFRRQQEQMRALGIELAPQKELASRILKRLGEKRPAGPASAESTGKGASAASAPDGGVSRLDPAAEAHAKDGEPLVIPDKLITASWVRSRSDFPGGRIIVRKDAIISPLARDLLKAMGVAVRRAE